jgi:hypothetical protein
MALLLSFLGYNRLKNTRTFSGLEPEIDREIKSQIFN